jgi:hypothetical protein
MSSLCRNERRSGTYWWLITAVEGELVSLPNMGKWQWFYSELYKKCAGGLYYIPIE